MADQATVYVIDDDGAVRESLQWLLESVAFHVQTFDTAQAFLDHAVRGLASHSCLIADVRLPGMSGLDLQDRLNERGMEIPVIIITGHGDVPVAVRALKAGAVDFIEKPFSDQVLLDRIRDALESHATHRATRAEHGEISDRLKQLTRRERQVLDMVVQGKLNKQIATELGLSHKTIEVHRSHVMHKMSATCLADLVRMVVSVEGE